MQATNITCEVQEWSLPSPIASEPFMILNLLHESVNILLLQMNNDNQLVNKQKVINSHILMHNDEPEDNIRNFICIFDN